MKGFCFSDSDQNIQRPAFQIRPDKFFVGIGNRAVQGKSTFKETVDETDDSRAGEGEDAFKDGVIDLPWGIGFCFDRRTSLFSRTFHIWIRTELPDCPLTHKLGSAPAN